MINYFISNSELSLSIFYFIKGDKTDFFQCEMVFEIHNLLLLPCQTNTCHIMGYESLIWNMSPLNNVTEWHWLKSLWIYTIYSSKIKLVINWLPKISIEVPTNLCLSWLIWLLAISKQMTSSRKNIALLYIKT